MSTEGVMSIVAVLESLGVPPIPVATPQEPEGKHVSKHISQQSPLPYYAGGSTEQRVKSDERTCFLNYTHSRMASVCLA